MGQQENPRDEDQEPCVEFCFGTLGLLLVAWIVWLIVSVVTSPPARHPDYMVSITGADGLSMETTSGGGGVPTTLSPVFTLTVRIYNPGNLHDNDDGCVWGLSTAVVSYGDAFLGKGSVPPFCAEEKEAQERAATAWGEDVVLPRFLRERLSAELGRGEASLDVQVTMPTQACFNCNDRVLVCSKVKIGESSPSSCLVKRVRPTPAVGSTPTTG